MKRRMLELSRHHQYMENTDSRKRCALRAGAEATERDGLCSRSTKVSIGRRAEHVCKVAFCCYCLQCKRSIRHGVLHGCRCVRYYGNASFRRCFCCTNGLSSLIFSSCFITSFMPLTENRPHFGLLKTKTLTLSVFFFFFFFSRGIIKEGAGQVLSLTTLSTIGREGGGW